MRDVEVLNDADVAYTRPGPGQFPEDTTYVDKSFDPADKAHVMPSLGGDFGVGARPVLSGPVDGGQAKLAADPTLVAPAAPVATPAYARTGRSINQTTKKRLYPWISTPGKGLTQSYASNAAGAMAMQAEAERPGDDDEDDDDEDAKQKPIPQQETGETQQPKGVAEDAPQIDRPPSSEPGVAPGRAPASEPTPPIEPEAEEEDGEEDNGEEEDDEPEDKRKHTPADQGVRAKAKPGKRPVAKRGK